MNRIVHFVTETVSSYFVLFGKFKRNTTSLVLQDKAWIITGEQKYDYPNLFFFLLLAAGSSSSL